MWYQQNDATSTVARKSHGTNSRRKLSAGVCTKKSIMSSDVFGDTTLFELVNAVCVPCCLQP